MPKPIPKATLRIVLNGRMTSIPLPENAEIVHNAPVTGRHESSITRTKIYRLRVRQGGMEMK